MIKPKTLRQRLITTTAIIVTISSTLFAGGLLLIKQRLEAATFGNIVREHINILIDDPDKAEVLNNPLFNEWRYFHGDDIAKLPEAIQTLPPGAYHAVKVFDKHYHLQVAQSPAGKIYLLYDISEWEKQEHALLSSLLTGVVIILILALIIAGQAATSILEPVRRLTQRLSHLPPSQRGYRIAPEFADSDVGQIASAFDNYLERIDQFVERERSFTASASHELRTPLSVMVGAVDVIEANEPSAASQRALTRIRRACQDMLDFIEATLFLSREEDRAINQTSSADLKEILQQLVEDQKGDIDRANIALAMQVENNIVLPTPTSLVKITLANLLRNAIEHSRNGSITLALRSNAFVIQDSGAGISAQDLPFIFDRSYTTKADGTGLGLNMVKRICDRYGWKIDIASEAGTGTTVTLTFAELHP